MVAQAFATLGCLAPGRVFLGVGTGESLNEVPPLGIEWPGFKERLDRLEEASTDPAAVGGGAGQLRGRVLPHAPGDGV